MAAEFFVTEVKSVHKRDYLAGKVYRQSGRPLHGLVFVLSGKLTLWQDGSCVDLPTDSILFLKKQDRYRLRNTEKRSASFIVVSYQVTPDAAFLPLLPGQVFFSARPGRFRDLFSGLLKLPAYSPCAQARLCAAVQDILCRIIQENYRQGIAGSDNYTELALHFMEDHFSENLNSAQIADAAGVSVSHLRSLFKKQYGVSLIRYLNSLRVEQAKQLLGDGLLTLSEVAAACGFQNEYYFSRVFKQFTGIPPGKY